MPLICFFVIFCELKSLNISILKCDISYRVRNGLTNLNIGVTHLLFEIMSWEMMNFSDLFNSFMSELLFCPQKIVLKVIWKKIIWNSSEEGKLKILMKKMKMKNMTQNQSYKKRYIASTDLIYFYVSGNLLETSTSSKFHQLLVISYSILNQK